MKVRMLRTTTGSPDGLRVELYGAGKKYELPPALAQVFLTTGAAEEDKELVLETKDTVLEVQPGKLNVADALRPGKKRRK